MLSAVNSVRPYSVNNYTNAQNSAKSQPSFGSAASEVAEQGTKKGAGFFRKVRRFLNNAKYDLGANAAFAGTWALVVQSGNSWKEKLAMAAVCKAGAELSSLQAHFSGLTNKSWLQPRPLSISHHPLSPIAWVADAWRIIAKSVQD